MLNSTSHQETPETRGAQMEGAELSSFRKVNTRTDGYFTSRLETPKNSQSGYRLLRALRSDFI